MSNYDDYFTHDDKPFAENINDALLLSNVFDLTVPVEMPKMFRDSTWVNSTSQRKCSVAIVTLKETLPSGVSISTLDGKSVLTGTGTVKLGFYPNFNAFGKYKSITWDSTGSLTVNLKTVSGGTIANNITNGTISSESIELRQLQEIVIEIVFNNATLKVLEVVMENKQQTRYGAEVGISDVNGLEERLSSIETFDNNIFDLVYPVGSIYMSVNNTSPATLFGGTWEQVKDRFLLSAGNTYTNGATGGEATHTLTTNEMPSHTHTQNPHSHKLSPEHNTWTANNESSTRSRFQTSSSGNKYAIAQESENGWIWAGTSQTTATNQNTGGGQAHNNMPPYIVVNVWKRTA